MGDHGEVGGDQLRIKDTIPGLQDLGSSGLDTELPDDSAKPTSGSKAKFSILRGTARPWEARSSKHVRWTFPARQRLFENDVMFAEEQVTTNLPLSRIEINVGLADFLALVNAATCIDAALPLAKQQRVPEHVNRLCCV